MKRAWILSLVLLAASVMPAQQGATVVPNEALIVDSVPPIPASIAERADAYTNYRTANVFDWHPQRREMLIGTRFADTTQVHRITMPGGAREQVTFFPDRIGSATYRPHTGDYFVFSKDIGGGEWYQLFRFDVPSGVVTLLTDGKSRNLGPVFSNQGDRIVYSSTRRDRADLDFYVMNPADNGTDKLLSQNQGGGWNVRDWSPDDKTLLAVEEVSVNESHLFLVDVGTGQKTPLTPADEKLVAYAPIGFSADGKGVFVTTDKDNEFQRVAYIDLATKRPRYLTNYGWDVEDAQLSKNRKLLAFTLNENGMSTLHVMQLDAGLTGSAPASRRVGARELPLPKLPAGLVSDLEWHEDNVDLAFSITSARSPTDVYSIHLPARKLERWTMSETGGLNAASTVEPQLVKWKSFDGKQISGWLYMPSAGKFPGKRPVIVNIHGGPEGQSRPGFLGRNNYYLDELGIAMVFPNVRGSTGYGKTWVALDNGFKREDSYKDIEALLRWIKQQPNLDGDKIMVTGGSYGGHMTLATATRYNDLIACSVDVVGMSNLVTFLEHTEPYRQDLRRVEYGDERDPKMREFLESIAPINHVNNVTKPMFVVAGVNDPRVPKSEADQMVAALKSESTPVWYLAAKDEGHGFAKKKNADFQFYATVLFVEKYLLGEQTTVAGK
jgi:dipeptidyl aminopeptidase/acylaminoacyl peptidase